MVTSDRSRSAPPRLSVVIPTYRAPDLALAAAAALDPLPDWGELIVVDDGSGDDTVARLRAAYPNVVALGLQGNRGFGGAVNAGFEHARGKYLATLNNDARATWEALAQLCDFLDSAAPAGAVAPALCDDAGRAQRVGFRFPAPAPMKLLRWLRHERSDPTAPHRVDYAKGACVVFRRAALEQTGLFDQQYWMFAEEIDLFRRLDRAGWQSWVVPAATVTHGEGISTRNHPDRATSSRYRIQSYRSMCRYWNKHHGLLAVLLMRAEMAIRLIGRTVSAAARAGTGRGDPWWVGEHMRCLRVLLGSWPSRPEEPPLEPSAPID